MQQNTKINTANDQHWGRITIRTWDGTRHRTIRRILSQVSYKAYLQSKVQVRDRAWNRVWRGAVELVLEVLE